MNEQQKQAYERATCNMDMVTRFQIVYSLIPTPQQQITYLQAWESGTETERLAIVSVLYALYS